ncbi:MAG TPA: ABC transporter ATP-binding protein [bacterium]|nr:ABC transporter ATP-binding protein [bacterium]
MRSRRFWAYIRRHRRAYAVGYAGGLVSIAMAQLSPWVLKFAVDGIRRHMAAGPLAGYAAALVALAAGEAVASYVMRWSILAAAYRVETELRREYFAHLQRMPLAFFERIPTGDLMARAVNDLRAVQRVAGVGLMRSVHTTVMLAASVAFMLTISVRLTLLMLAILPFATLVFFLLGREVHRRFDAVQAQFSALSARVQEMMSGIRVVKAFAREPDQLARFQAASNDVVRANLSLARAQGALWPSIGLILGVASVVLLWQGGGAVIRGTLTLGQMVQFSYYLARLSFPMIALGWVTNLWQQGRASMARLDAIFAEAPGIDDPASPLVIGDIRGEITFRRTSVVREGTAALRDVDLVIPAGRTVAIVGPTGAGKTTLVSLIPRILDPTEGQVLLDGHDVRHLPLAALRAAVAVVPQEPFLFSDTLYENIAFGAAAAADRTQVLHAGVVSQIAVDAADFPLGYETMVGERGVTLSGGQRQRATLARAVVRDPRVLILDDALSSVDTQTEQAILRHLREVMTTRTSIVIAHRISTIRGADRIVVLDAGRVVDQGTHQELVARGGLYADLYERELLREALEAADPDETGPGDAAAKAAGTTTAPRADGSRGPDA